MLKPEFHKPLPELDNARLRPGLRHRLRDTKRATDQRHADAVERALRILDQQAAA